MLVYPFCELGSRLLERRQALGLTADGVAAQLGVTSDAVERFEAGLWRPTPPLLARIAALLGASYGELIALGRYAASGANASCRCRPVVA